MFALLFALGLWPLLVIAATSILLIAFLEFDKEAGAAFTAVAGTALVLAITATNPLPWIATNGLTILLGVVVYLVVGVLYSFPKWMFWLLRQRDKLQARLDEYPSDDTHRLGILANYKQPTWRENKARITGWMTFWPWSAAWTLINDPVRRFFRFVSERLSGAYQHISNKIFGKFDFATATTRYEAARLAEKHTTRR